MVGVGLGPPQPTISLRHLAVRLHGPFPVGPCLSPLDGFSLRGDHARATPEPNGSHHLGKVMHLLHRLGLGPLSGFSPICQSANSAESARLQKHMFNALNLCEFALNLCEVRATPSNRRGGRGTSATCESTRYFDSRGPKNGRPASPHGPRLLAPATFGSTSRRATASGRLPRWIR